MSDTVRQNTAYDAAAQEKLQQVQSNFGAAAADYVTSKVHASGQDLTWVVETAALTGTERVLDVATGAGHTAFALAPYAAEVVALDITKEMLAVAQKTAVERHLDNVRFQEGDAQQLPCDDASFDVVTCRHAPHHFPHVQRAVREWARVLKPGGKLVLVDSISPEEPEIDTFLNEIEMLRDPSHVRNQRLSEWVKLLNEAGLTVNSTREFGLFLDIPSWTQRMRTPAESVVTIERLFRAATPAIRTRLHIEEKEEAFGFTLPTGLIAAVSHTHLIPIRTR
jgi:ubiquinone/menaquinone biosynthesis C-methylase UbiE